MAKSYSDYLEAVDVVCDECLFSGHQCKTCPVRKTNNRIIEQIENGEEDEMVIPVDNHKVKVSLTVSQIELAIAHAEMDTAEMKCQLTPRELRQPDPRALVNRNKKLIDTLSKALNKYKEEHYGQNNN